MGAPEFKDIVIDHKLVGVTPEMIDWFFVNMVDTRFYKLWHPWSHIGIEWEVPPTEEMRQNRNIGAIQVVEEKIGDAPVFKGRLRIIDPAESPIKAIYPHQRATMGLGPDDKPSGWIMHEYKAAPYGTIMRSTFRRPADTPEEANARTRQHNKEEMGFFPVFLPELYKLAMIWEGAEIGG